MASNLIVKYLFSQAFNPLPEGVLKSRLMPFGDLQQFVHHLESKGQLKRIRAEVDPELEAGEIAQRVLREQGPALLFERPKGSSIPLLMNLFGTLARIRAALGREPAEIGN
jgi:4-hydroxy-3-polyprenylbenzoate decarboxylase